MIIIIAYFRWRSWPSTPSFLHAAVLWLPGKFTCFPLYHRPWWSCFLSPFCISSRTIFINFLMRIQITVKLPGPKNIYDHKTWKAYQILTGWIFETSKRIFKDIFIEPMFIVHRYQKATLLFCSRTCGSSSTIFVDCNLDLCKWFTFISASKCKFA